MRKLDFGVLFLGVVIAVVWTVFSGRNGFESGSAVIVARSISVSSTIGGRVVSPRPDVGSKVLANDLLVKIEDGRIDRGRLAELESQEAFLKSEIENVQSERKRLAGLLDKFEHRASAFRTWIVKDLHLKKAVRQRELDAAVERNKLDADEIDRTQALYRQSVRSEASLTTAKTKAAITRNQVEASKAELARIGLHERSIAGSEVFFEGGDTSYWAKMSDTIKLRLLDNDKQLSTLKAQLIRTRAQAQVEGARINLSFTEEHRATINGMVNAVFINKGSRVAAGTPLLQILDCSEPVIIVPLPEHRIGEFSIGQKVTVYPIDSEQALTGKIQYISSGPLLGLDKTIAVQQELTTDGNRAIVNFDKSSRIDNATLDCDPTRLAVAVVHTETLFGWISASLGGVVDQTVAGLVSMFPASSPEPENTSTKAARPVRFNKAEIQ